MDNPLMDQTNEASELNSAETPQSPFCASLRSKKLFMRDVLPTEASDYLDSSSQCWCQMTQRVIGEVVTTGRDALMAWNVTAGSWKATDLTGARAIAIVNSEENLANAQAARRSELILDQSASHDQKVAMLEALKSRYAAALGDIMSVRSAPIVFKHEGKTYDVSAS